MWKIIIPLILTLGIGAFALIELNQSEQEQESEPEPPFFVKAYQEVRETPAFFLKICGENVVIQDGRFGFPDVEATHTVAPIYFQGDQKDLSFTGCMSIGMMQLKGTSSPVVIAIPYYQ